MPKMDGMEASINIREYLHSKGLKQPLIIGCTGHIE